MMTNKEAINLLRGLEQSLDDYCELNDEGKKAFNMAVSALELFGNSEQLPSAQPERKKGCKIVKGTGYYGYCACDQCGKPVHPEDLFCSKCGADFREDQNGQTDHD